MSTACRAQSTKDEPSAGAGDAESSALRIALATTDDLPLIRAILEDVLLWLAARKIRQWTRPFGDDWIIEKIAAGEFFVVRRDGAPVAVVRLLWSDHLFWGERDQRDAAYVHSLAVRRDRAGQGIGAAVLSWAEDRARRNGRRFLRLDCAAGNRALGDYYRRLGFVPVGPATVGGETVLLFEMDLGEEEA